MIRLINKPVILFAITEMKYIGKAGDGMVEGGERGNSTPLISFISMNE
jgi:hypothetical protein